MKQISFQLMSDETVVFKKEIDFSKLLFFFFKELLLRKAAGLRMHVAFIYFSFISYCICVSFSLISLQAPDQCVGICFSDEIGL